MHNHGKNDNVLKANTKEKTNTTVMDVTFSRKKREKGIISQTEKEKKGITSQTEKVKKGIISQTEKEKKRIINPLALEEGCLLSNFVQCCVVQVHRYKLHSMYKKKVCLHQIKKD